MGDLFIIRTFELKDLSARTLIEIDETHDIFKGHFPNHPVLPGVCMIQMVEQTLNRIFNRNVCLNKASIIKFLAIIDPCKHKQVDLQLNYSIEEENIIKVNAQIYRDDTVFFKFKGEGA